MQVIVLSTFFEVDVSLGSIYQILLSFFEINNVIYGLYALEVLFTIDTLYFLIYWILLAYMDSEFCIQKNQPS